MLEEAFYDFLALNLFLFLFSMADLVGVSMT